MSSKLGYCPLSYLRRYTKIEHLDLNLVEDPVSLNLECEILTNIF